MCVLCNTFDQNKANSYAYVNSEIALVIKEKKKQKKDNSNWV